MVIGQIIYKCIKNYLGIFNFSPFSLKTHNKSKFLKKIRKTGNAIKMFAACPVRKNISLIILFVIFVVIAFAFGADKKGKKIGCIVLVTKKYQIKLKLAKNMLLLVHLIYFLSQYNRKIKSK